MTCSECDRPVLAKGLCASHYQARRASALRAAVRAISRPCQQCGKDLAGKRPNAMYCSTECKYAAREEARKADLAAQRENRVCAVCSGPIPKSMSMRAVTCSRACGITYQNTKKALVRDETKPNRPPCPECGKHIPNETRWGATYCSPACKKKAHERRWRERSPHYMRQYLYGISQEEYEALLESQHGGCAICKTTEWTGKHRVPHVDHDHKTGRIRGLLCDSCNQGLGRFHDDPKLLRAAVRYLETNP